MTWMKWTEETKKKVQGFEGQLCLLDAVWVKFGLTLIILEDFMFFYWKTT